MTFDEFRNLFYRPKEYELRVLELYRQDNPNRLNEEQFEKLADEIVNRKKNTLSDQYVDLKLWYNGFPSREKSFANYLIDLLKDYRVTRILNVGAGRFATVSGELINEGYDVYSIDPRLEVTGEKFIKEEFRYDNPFSESFDLVIGQEPCEATEHIIRYCEAHQIPYFIVLCGVPHDSISGEKFETAQEWYEYLMSLTSGAEFVYPDLLPLWESRAIVRM